jgi:hypothetical protein
MIQECRALGVLMSRSGGASTAFERGGSGSSAPATPPTMPRAASRSSSGCATVRGGAGNCRDGGPVDRLVAAHRPPARSPPTRSARPVSRRRPRRCGRRRRACRLRLRHACGGAAAHARHHVRARPGRLSALHPLCLRSAPERRRGLATRLLRAYLPYAQATTPALAEVRLLCKPLLAPLYAAAGIGVVGPSAVVHGAEAWTEMALELE